MNNRLLTADVTIARFEGLQFKFGQWKANYSRERVDSSGKQQFAERSIVNRVFTLDRQKGAMVTGRLMKGTLGDSRYYWRRLLRHRPRNQLPGRARAEVRC